GTDQAAGDCCEHQQRYEKASHGTFAFSPCKPCHHVTSHPKDTGRALGLGEEHVRILLNRRLGVDALGRGTLTPRVEEEKRYRSGDSEAKGRKGMKRSQRSF